MKKIKKLLMVIVIALSLTAPSTVPLIGTVQTISAAIQISKKSVTLVKGQNKTLKISGTSKKATWHSSNKTVATVTQKGCVTAKKKGTAIITAKIGSQKYICKIYVQTPSISATSRTIRAGTTIQLKMNGTNQRVIWKSSNTSIATISANGLIKGKSSGTCNIYATVLGKRYSCKLTVRAVEQVTTVWLSATGEKYHKIRNCGRMNPAKARKMSRTDAIRSGYQACEKCF